MARHPSAEVARLRAEVDRLRRRLADLIGDPIASALRPHDEQRLLGDLAVAESRLAAAQSAAVAGGERSAPREFLRRLRIARAPGARLFDAATYETAVRRGFLVPLLRDVGEGLLAAGDLYHLLRDAIRETIAEGAARYGAAVPGIVDAETARQVEAHRRRFERGMRRHFGVDPLRTIRQVEVRPAIREFVRENVRLIKTIPPRLHDRLAADLDRLAGTRPFDRAAVRKVIADGYRSAGYNLRRLTRDQTNKLAGQLNEIKQTSLGISRYRWRTSLDERVRPLHQGNEGQLFRWDDPPAGTGHPGWDIQCRCTADAVIEAGARVGAA